MQQPNSPENSQVTAQDLARELRTKPQRIYSLLDHGYLTAIFRSDFPDLTLIERPAPGVLAWLRMMLHHQDYRPMFPVSVAAELLKISSRDIRRLCADAGQPIHVDPFFGEIISLHTVEKLRRNLWLTRNPMSFDRQGMLEMFASYLRIKLRCGRPEVPPHVRINEEISRINRLEEPDRFVRAAAFWAAYNDARSVAECLRLYHGITGFPPSLAKLDKRMTDMEHRLSGLKRWPGDPPKKRPKSSRRRSIRWSQRFRSKLDDEQMVRWEAAKAECAGIIRKVKAELRSECAARDGISLADLLPASVSSDPSGVPSLPSEEENRPEADAPGLT